MTNRGLRVLHLRRVQLLRQLPRKTCRLRRGDNRSISSFVATVSVFLVVVALGAFALIQAWKTVSSAAQGCAGIDDNAAELRERSTKSEVRCRIFSCQSPAEGSSIRGSVWAILRFGIPIYSGSVSRYLSPIAARPRFSHVSPPTLVRSLPAAAGPSDPTPGAHALSPIDHHY